MANTRHVNLVFQGGGMRGVVYAGVIESIPKHCKVQAVAGTSAGAIVAALLAVGTAPERIRRILEDSALRKLLDETEIARRTRIENAWRDARILFPKIMSGNRRSLLSIWQYRKKHKRALDDLREIWNSRGFHGSQKVREWLDDVLEEKKFEDIVLKDLRIVAADVSGQRYVVYEKEGHLDRPIAEAVHASISIPLFFVPFTSGPQHLVDGGILSNFPSFLFARAEYPTIGFRLTDIDDQGPIETTWGYLKGLLRTMAEAHDKERGDPPWFKSYEIKTPDNIASTKFDISSRDLAELFAIGQAVGRTVDWDRHSSDKPVVSSYDPRPDEALDFALKQAHQLWERYHDQSLWVDEYEQDVVFTVHIEADWTSRYDRFGRIAVHGPKSLFFSRMIVTSTNKDFATTSIADYKGLCQEITASGNQDVIQLPAINLPTTRGYMLLYAPPISEGPARTFHSTFKVHQEFLATLGAGRADKVIYSARQLARDHRLRLKVRILFDVDIADGMRPRLPGERFEAGEVEFDETTRRNYRVYECILGPRQITDKMSFEVELSPNSVN
jgi:NTE family protein